MKRTKKSIAFTLAEVLITIAIIGIVAALTIPNLITRIQDKQFHAQWKKIFAEVSQAYRMPYEVGDHPYASNWSTLGYGDYDRSAAETYYRIFSNLKTDDFCVTGVTDSSCGGDRASKHKWYNNSASPMCLSINGDYKSSYKDVNYYGFCMYNGSGGWARLNKGTILFAHGYLWSRPDILVDVNGSSGPNIVGRDMYIILIRDDKVIAGGAPGYELKGCSMDISSANGANDAESLSGSGCGYKYLYEK